MAKDDRTAIEKLTRIALLNAATGQQPTARQFRKHLSQIGYRIVVVSEQCSLY